MFREDQIISLFFAPDHIPVDDCAYLSESQQIITGDSMVEHTHFRREWHPPALLARKFFQSNLSDIAAGGGDPDWCLLQIGIPADLDEAYLKAFAIAFRQECEQAHCRLIGGDTFRSQSLLLGLTMAGRAIRPLGRRAEVGDALYVTGTIGLSLAGLRHLQSRLPDATPNDEYLAGGLLERALQRHLAPQARWQWARHLRTLPELHGMMDVSDGLIQDAERFARASKQCLHLHLDSIPGDAELQMSALERAISGEEYELLFTARPGLSFDFPTAQIGRVVAVREGNPLRIFQNSDEMQECFPEQRGFEHFKQ